MAVTFDAKAPSHTEATAGWNTATAATWTHTPVGTPRGILLAIVQGGGTGDQVSTVTYGGVAMTRVRSDINATAELGRTYVYHLGASIPTGAQTVSVTSTGTTPKYAVSYSFTAAADTFVLASNGADAGVVANPSITVTFPDTVAGWAGVAAHFYGGSAPVTSGLQTGETYGNGPDFGVLSGMTYYRSNGSSAASTTFGYTTLTSDDQLITAAVIAEDTGVSQALYTGAELSPGAQTGPSWAITPLGANAPAVGWAGAAAPSGAPVSLLGAGTQTVAHTRSSAASYAVSLTGTGSQAVTYAKKTTRTASLMGVGTQTASDTKNARGALSLTAIGTQTVTHTAGRKTTLALMGSGSQSASNTQGAVRAVVLSGSGTQSVGGRKASVSAVSLLGSGTQAIARVRAVSKAISLTGAGTQTVADKKGSATASAVTGTGTQAASDRKGAVASVSLTGAGTQAVSHTVVLPDQGITQALYTGPKAATGSQTGPSWDITPSTNNAQSVVWAGAAAPSSAAVALMGVGTQTAPHTVSGGNRNATVSLTGAGTQAVSHTISGGARSAPASLMGVGTQTAVHRKGARGSYTAYGPAVLADGAFAYWRLDEGSGTAVADQLGTRPGTISSPANVTLGVAGALPSGNGTGMAFAGGVGGVLGGPGVDITGNVTLSNPSLASIEMWVKHAGVGVTGPVFEARNGVAQPDTSLFVSAGIMRAYFQNSSGDASVIAPSAVTDGLWHHYVAVQEANQRVLYMDGVQVATLSTPGFNFNLNNATVHIAKDLVSSGRYFTGSIDEIALYPVALTATQVAAHYAAAGGAAFMGAGTQSVAHTGSANSRSAPVSLMGTGTQTIADSKGGVSSRSVGLPPFEVSVPGVALMANATSAVPHTVNAPDNRNHAVSLLGVGTQSASERKATAKAVAQTGVGTQAVSERKGMSKSVSQTGTGTQAVTHAPGGGSRSASFALMGAGSEKPAHIKGAQRSVTGSGSGTQTTASRKGSGRALSSLATGTQQALVRKGGRRSILLTENGALVVMHGVGSTPVVLLPTVALIADSTENAAITPNMGIVTVDPNTLTIAVDPNLATATVDPSSETVSVDPYAATAEIT